MIINKKERNFFLICVVVFVFLIYTNFTFAIGTKYTKEEYKAEFAEALYEKMDSLIAAESIVNTNIGTYEGEVTALADIVKTVANSLLAIFITIEILTELDRKGDEFRYEDALKIFIKLLILKNIIDIAPTILQALYDTAANILNAINANWDLTTKLNELALSFAEDKARPLDGKGNFDPAYLFVKIEIFVIGLGIWICGILVDVTAFTRVFQILILKSLSPIPLVFCGWSETKDTTKRFLLSFFAVSLQGVVIIVIFRIYIIILGTPIANISSGTQIIIATVALCKGVLSSGNWAKELLGTT